MSTDELLSLLFPIHGLSIKDLQTELKKSELGKVFAKQLSSAQEAQFEINKEQYYPIKNISEDKSYNQNKFWNMSDHWNLDEPNSQNPLSASIIKKQGDYSYFWNRQNSFIFSMENIYAAAKIKNRKNLL